MTNETISAEFRRWKLKKQGGMDISELLDVVPNELWVDVFVMGNDFGFGTICIYPEVVE